MFQHWYDVVGFIVIVMVIKGCLNSLFGTSDIAREMRRRRRKKD